MTEETLLCKLCLEPVTNFICVDCLFGSVKKWILLTEHVEIIPKIIAKHDDIKSLIQLDTEGTICVKCRQNVGEIACPCCYLYEIYIISTETSQELANEFEKYFNFDFKIHNAYSQLTFWQSLHTEAVSGRTFEPIVIAEEQSLTDVNVCENCGQISDRIMGLNGSFVCETCIEENKIELFRPFSIDFQ